MTSTFLPVFDKRVNIVVVYPALFHNLIKDRCSFNLLHYIVLFISKTTIVCTSLIVSDFKRAISSNPYLWCLSVIGTSSAAIVNILLDYTYIVLIVGIPFSRVSTVLFSIPVICATYRLFSISKHGRREDSATYLRV
jgi:hypothetical protein